MLSTVAASSISCFSGVARELWKAKKEDQPKALQLEADKEVQSRALPLEGTSHKTECTAASLESHFHIPTQDLKLQSNALDAKILKFHVQEYSGEEQKDSFGRTLEACEEFEVHEIDESTEASSCSESNSNQFETRWDISDKVGSVNSSPRNDPMYDWYMRPEEQLCSKAFIERVAELKKKIGSAPASCSKLYPTCRSHVVPTILPMQQDVLNEQGKQICELKQSISKLKMQFDIIQVSKRIARRAEVGTSKAKATGIISP
eukprot:gnl/MRDRNA2_/MRDRNA2_35079_c0_seq1.p1 gnl/MRDRNA2_/MRDRNA2_35079_c0~~gnl/MRDRNA2_/MRDRNA2_35079_c0_seq1.p1  ORF type:complete len:277 (+),score=56.62 gnl/MRDRNA2_/MRDRNA2_35079_c0_seq1:50-832(+)